MTGKAIELPSEPKPWRKSRDTGQYSFAYHPTTGKYMVVHASSLFTTTRGKKMAGKVHMYTLGDPDWREVPTPPGSSYNDSGNLVSVDGTTYWLTAGADRVVALELDDERITSFDGPPVVRHLQMSNKNAIKCHLTSVQNRLGMVIMRQSSAATTRVDVWVLEHGGGGDRRQPCWSRRYSLLEASNGSIDHDATVHARWVRSERTGRWRFL